MIQIQEEIRKTQFQVCKKSLKWFASLLLYEKQKRSNNMKQHEMVESFFHLDFREVWTK
jgi:hypothetical protein